MKFPFYDAPNTATITCFHILENGEPILYHMMKMMECGNFYVEKHMKQTKQS
jgi:hypothetical protein